jgi:molybdate transport system substrate-binding protein
MMSQQRTTKRTILATAGATILLAALAACSTPAATATPNATPKASISATADSLSGAITVYGAASLTATFTKLASQFEAAHPGVTVQTTFNGSAILVTQIQAGAPADVFASADTANMAKLTTASLVKGSPINFATNTLEIAVPVGNPAKIASFADLAKQGIKTVICAPAVPCGAAALAIEKATGVSLTPVSEETAVTGVLSKVQTGEADAGLVYVTDVAAAAGKVTGITFAESSKAVNTYPIAALAGSKNAKVAAAFVAFVTSKAGQAVLSAAGFGKP